MNRISPALSVISAVLALVSVLAIPASAGEYVRASLLTMSPGREAFQAFGHAALRLECPSQGLDFVFSFEGDPSQGILSSFVDGTRARFVALDSKEYFDYARSEGRGLREYPLNLTDEEKVELWRQADNAVLAPPSVFDIRRHNCMSAVMALLQQSVSPSRIHVEGSELFSLDNGYYSSAALRGRSPWSLIAFKAVYGADSDLTDEALARTSPLTFDIGYTCFLISSPDGHPRRLVSSSSELVAPSLPDVPGRFTPVTAAALIVILALIGVAACLFPEIKPIACMADISLLLFDVVAGLVLMFVSWAPYSIGSSWSWNFIVFNPVLALTLVALRRHTRSLYIFAAGWATMLLLYAVASPYITSEAETAVRITAAAIGLRVAFENRRLAAWACHMLRGTKNCIH